MIACAIFVFAGVYALAVETANDDEGALFASTGIACWILAFLCGTGVIR